MHADERRLNLHSIKNDMILLAFERTKYQRMNLKKMDYTKIK